MVSVYDVVFKGVATVFKDKALATRLARYDWVTLAHLDIGELDCAPVRAAREISPPPSEDVGADEISCSIFFGLIWVARAVALMPY
jgi:hypothetical protein